MSSFLGDKLINVIAHTLAKVVTNNTSPSLYHSAPFCISDIILNELMSCFP